MRLCLVIRHTLTHTHTPPTKQRRNTGKLDPREKAVLPPQEEVEALSRRVAREGVHHRLVQVGRRFGFIRVL